MNILGYEYRVVSYETADDSGSYGRFHSKTQKLQIANDLCVEQKISTVLHEILEAVNYHLEIQLTHQNIMSLETALYQVMKENGIDLTPLLKGINSETLA